MNVARLGILLFAVVVAAFLMRVRDSVPEAVPARRAIPVPSGGPLHGVALQIHSFGSAVPRHRRAIDEIAALGADTLLIAAAAYQDHAASNDLALDAKRTGTPEEWAEIFAAARQGGLRIILMPIILLDNPRGNEWRGVIRPDNWDVWFDRYRIILTYFARLAAQHKVEVLMVGSELVSTEVHTDRWKRVIREVRAIYPPPGKLAYSANWDHYRNIEYWDDVDLIGMTTYYKLADQPGPTLDALEQAWKPIRNDILAWQQKIGKPILFTEVGWASQEGCSVEAWNYYRHDKATAAGLEEQKRCYQAFTNSWRNVDGVGGVIWWEWTSGQGGHQDFGYTPKAKPAERVLRDWFVYQRQQRAKQAASDAPTKEETKTAPPGDTGNGGQGSTS